MNTSIKQHFDEYAKSHRWQNYYEENLNSKNCNFYLRYSAYQRIVDEFSPKNVIDIGCGSGDFINLFTNTSIRYHGIDFSQEMINSVQEKIASLPEQERIRFTCEQQDFRNMEIKERYDFLLASGFLEYFDDLEPIAAKLYALTENQGILAIQVPNREYYRWKNKKQTITAKKNFVHNRISKSECDRLFLSQGYRFIQGLFVNQIFFPYSRHLPKLYVHLSETLQKWTPEIYSRHFASMYIGIYQK